MGDFNTKLEEESLPDIVGPYSSGTRNGNGERRVTFARNHRLMATKTSFEQKDQKDILV